MADTADHDRAPLPAAGSPDMQSVLDNQLFNNNNFTLLNRRTVLAAGAASVFLPTLARAAAGIALGVRVHDHGTHTRLVVELSDPVDYSLFRLADPYRVVVDLPELDWSFRPDASAVQAGFVHALRVGLFAPGQSRIVLDLTGPVDISKAFVLPATGATPFRIVMDLTSTTREAFLQVVGPLHRVGSLNRPAPPVEAEAPAPPRTAPPAKSAGKKTNKTLIAIDPGHGGIDPGAIGVDGIYEKAITLAAATQLKARLESTGRYRTLMTRSADVSLGLRQRIEIARRAEADLFISLHADSIQNKSIRGLSVYTLSEQSSDAEAAALAESENKADLLIGMDLTNESQEVRNILIDLAQRESMNLATRLATSLIGELRQETTLLRTSHRFAGFAVLKSPDIPSVLVEMGYLSNRDDENALRKEIYRGKLMAAVVRGVDEYVATLQSAHRT